jgi:penicillin amidase
MRITARPRTHRIAGRDVSLARTPEGVVRVRAENDTDLARGLGLAHAHDRLVQMVMVRLIGQGRLSECLKSSAETVAIDVVMREIGFARAALRETAELTSAARDLVDAYSEGVNHALERHVRPLELLLVRHKPEPWTAADTLITIKLMSYIGLAQSQQDMERFLIEALRAGAPLAKLQALCSPHLDDLDDATVRLIRKLRIDRPLISPSIRFLSAAPTLMASNNWAVSGSRSASGSPIQCNDPHLECNRLPAIWYEAVMETSDGYRIGATMPGVPGLVMGRTRWLSFGFTYGFMDMIDYFVEDCRDGKFRRGDGFRSFDARTETIVRRGGDPLEITIRENDLGVLEAPSTEPTLADGYYLTRAWSARDRGAATSLNALALLGRTRTVSEAQKVLREVAISANWVLADRDGAIGYQQSGLLPDRRHSGLFPVPAWDHTQHWRGTVPGDRLHSILDPEEGFLATANNDMNPPGGPLVINLPMGSYRVDRIRALLSDCRSCTLDDMGRIQNDLYSLQAERFMELLRPFLPDSFAGRMLSNWDCRYDTNSRGATLFETVYHALLGEVFGRGLFGAAVWQHLVDDTAVVADYYHLFDDAVLSGDPIWFGSEGRDRLIRRVVAEQLTEVDPASIIPWGRKQRMVMRNIFFDGTLPSFLGFDHGPVELPGNRATVTQGGIFNSHDRQTTFTPSWRFLTDLGDDVALTALAGGPSGRRFSRWYTTDVQRWLTGKYKTLAPEKSSNIQTFKR